MENNRLPDRQWVVETIGNLTYAIVMDSTIRAVAIIATTTASNILLPGDIIFISSLDLVLWDS